MLTTINLSTGLSNHSQRNNKLFPYSTCNTTSFAMFLKYGKIVNVDMFEEKKHIQFEDHTTDFIQNDPRVREYYKKYNVKNYNAWLADPNGKAVTPPNQVHHVLSYGINLMISELEPEFLLVDKNRFIDGKCTKYLETYTMQDIAYDLIQGKPIIPRGMWAGLAHIVCVVGLTSHQDDIKSVSDSSLIDLTMIEDIIIDDPYGNYKLDYKTENGRRGNDVYVPYKEYINITRTQATDIKKHVHILTLN